ncbi:MAG: 5'/3'-nucleotidase SurE [Deltaproteobacteria bacterium]|nr:5'/3'-nucleotidase SurE [Deltaproteobacteria bacterium]
MQPPRFLLSNDDGFEAAGIQALAAALAALGEVWIVAPDREQSATSHAISLQRPLRIRQLGVRQYVVDGTPTDCVYLGLHHLLTAPPSVVVSGINHGPNLGNDVLYSGTVAAAMEGALFGYPAVAVSLCLSDSGPTRFVTEEFAVAAELGAKIAAAVASRPMQRGVVLNLNVPIVPRAALKGVKLCRLGYTDWSDSVSKRTDPRGKPYYWIGGDRAGVDNIADSDNNATAAGYASLTPIHYDLTDYRSFAQTRDLLIAGFEHAADNLGSGPLAYPPHPRA